MNIIKTSLAIGIAALGFGCAGGTLPTEQLASTEASVRAAQELGAQNVPRAELHLRLAKEQVERAHKLADDGDEERATMQLERARADAELAVALARQAAAQRDLDANAKSAVTNPQPAIRAAAQ
jgi:hypothetical protein